MVLAAGAAMHQGCSSTWTVCRLLPALIARPRVLSFGIRLGLLLHDWYQFQPELLTPGGSWKLWPFFPTTRAYAELVLVW